MVVLSIGKNILSILVAQVMNNKTLRTNDLSLTKIKKIHHFKVLQQVNTIHVLVVGSGDSIAV